ncbi:MAG: site-2 protease family protein [Verrucomicrobiales bacterium]|nr:site-2 protease family protein [Verrucomicrobiales bacterium]
MRGSFRFGRFFGVDVYIHFTFVLFLLFFGYLAWTGAAADDSVRTVPWKEAVSMMGLICALFTCVVLHEYGHVLAARKFGVPTRDITLLPIGGVARLERIPEKPSQELIVAIAGPAVNVAIALVLTLVLGVGRRLLDLDRVQQMQGEMLQRIMQWGGFLQTLLLANVVLVVFNLIPAFPMDGGRVLRAFLSMKMGRVRATQIAAKIGQFLAVLLGLWGLTHGHHILLFTALFVWIGASREAEDVVLQDRLSGRRVGDAMLTEFHSLRPTDTVAQAVDLILGGWQTDFPVTEGGRLVGIFTRHDLINAMKDGQPAPGLVVADLMRRDFPFCEADEPLEDCLQRLRAANLPLLPVMENRTLAGLLTPENVSEFLLLRTLAGRRQ